MNRMCIAACSAASFLVFTTLASADVASFGASKDNTIFSGSSSNRSNGAGDHFFAGRTNNGGLRRGLVAFDLSAVPTHAVVTSATLSLYMSRTISGPEQVAIHRVLRDWGEGASNANAEEGRGALAQPGDATWLTTFYPSSNWTNAGGDFVALASASTEVESSFGYTWSSALLTADVQSWISNPSANFGWMIRCDEVDGTSAKRFDTRENPIEDQRPLLTIEYTTVPEPATTAIAIVAGVLVSLRRR